MYDKRAAENGCYGPAARVDEFGVEVSDVIVPTHSSASSSSAAAAASSAAYPRASVRTVQSLVAVAVAAVNAGLASNEDVMERGVKVQKKVVKIAHIAASKRLAARVPLKDAARLAACAARGASLWLTVSPIEVALELTDSEMRSALRHQFGLSPISDEWYCKCGAAAEAGHFHACNRVSGPATYARHESVVNDLLSLGTAQLQMNVAKAPSIAVADGSIVMEEDRSRHIIPDVVFDGAGLTLAIDVSVCYAEAKSNLPKTRREVGKTKMFSALAKRAAAKVNKYRGSCAEQDIRFEPFVLESHGAMHSSASAVLDDLVKYGAAVLGCEEAELSGYMRRRVAIALQRGNAKLDRMAVMKSRNSYGAAVARGLVVAAADRAGVPRAVVGGSH